MIVKGAKRLIITLAVIAILLVLWAMQLPQYGDSAIGTVMVLMARPLTFRVTESALL